MSETGPFPGSSVVMAHSSAQPLTPVRESMLVFGRPDIQRDEIDEVVATLESGWIGTGPRTAQFEAEFASYLGVAEAVAVNSCTSALMLALRAAGIGPGDEVITTPLTFCATVNAILHAGATPVLADVDPATMNLDVTVVEALIGPRSRAILPVHFAGRACAIEELVDLADQHDLFVIEDCAHAVETTSGDRHVGTFGDFGCFSFYATKNVTTGEGGMVVARDPERLARIKTLALHGLTRDAWKRFGDEGYEHYGVVEAGFKCNMMDLQAAIGVHQLRRVESARLLRRAVWERYEAAFADLPLVLPAPADPATRHAYHLFSVLVDEERAGLSRDAFVAAMGAQNIGVGVHYVSLPEHPYYREALGWRAEDYPVAQHIGRHTVSLPLSPALTYDDVEDVILAVRRPPCARGESVTAVVADELCVLHSAPTWLPQTQTWMHTQIRHLPPAVESHVVCGTTTNLDQFPVAHLHSLADDAPWRWRLDRLARATHLQRGFGHIGSVARRVGAQILHSHFGHVGWMDLTAARRAGLAQVVTFYGQDASYLPRLDSRWSTRYAELFAAARMVLCEGPHFADVLRELGCPDDKVRVQHLGIELERYPFRPRRWSGDGPLRVLLAGSFTEKKGLTYAIDALARLRGEVELAVTIVGDAGRQTRQQQEKQRIQLALAASGLESRVRQLGFRPHRELRELAYDHDVFLSPSVVASDGDSEGGAPVTIIEMAATGMPVVSTTHCDIPAVLGPSGARLLAPERDAAELAHRLRTLLREPAAWSVITGEVRTHIEREYSAEIQGQRLTRLYAEL